MAFPANEDPEPETERRRCTAPTWNGDLNFSKWGPNGDLILSEMGTFGSRNGDQMGTKWGPKQRIFDKWTETC